MFFGGGDAIDVINIINIGRIHGIDNSMPHG